MTTAPKVRVKILTVDAKLLGSTPAVIAIAVGGAKYQLRHKFASLAAAERTADRVAQRGTIDPFLWDLVNVLPQSRAAAHIDARAERDAARAEASREARLAA
jgi:hypothetical protein